MPEFQYAVIIPAWNEAAFIESSVDAVKNAMRDNDRAGQLIVVDNNSTDNTAELASNAGAQVVFEPVNQISRARNAGANAADADIYIFVDADSHISAELLTIAIEAIEQGKVVGGGAQIKSDRPVGWPVQATFNSWNWISRLFKLAAGCFVYCRADAFDAVGGFSIERYAGEELALSRALRRWGRSRGMAFRIILEPRIETSVRKIDWYTPGQITRQMFVALLPWALTSKRLMGTWYDDTVRRTHDNDKQ